MKPSERGVAIVALLVAAAIVLGVIIGDHWLNGQEWFGVSANVVQLVSAPGLLAAIGIAAWARWHRRCGVRWCVRSGEHPVAGTLQKVCKHHHTLHHHRVVHAAHGAGHVASGKLDWGESHR